MIQRAMPEYTKRQRELLTEASKKFRDLDDPFSNSFLVEHNVTLDECAWMADEIGIIIDMYLATVD